MQLDQTWRMTASHGAALGISALLTLAASAYAQEAASPAAEPRTVTEAVAEDADTTTVIEDAGAVLSSSAPRSHVVQRGDTLWGLANMFLRDPWLWPEIWYVNPQVANPHLIYPGDVLALATGTDGQQSLSITRGNAARLQPLLRSTELDGPIAAIPYAAIASFLSKPGVIAVEEAKRAPYVLALRDRHLIAGAGTELYVKQLTAGAGERYNVMHVAQPLRDPDSRKVLGHLGVFTGVAQVTRPGDTATAVLASSAMETLQGDVLFADSGVAALSLTPHVPSREVKGQVLAVVNGVQMVGQYDVIAINRGTDHGLEPGHVLRANEATATANDRCAHINGNPTCRKGNTDLPDESSGTLLVFKTYERLSFALVLNETSPINVNDVVVNP